MKLVMGNYNFALNYFIGINAAAFTFVGVDKIFQYFNMGRRLISELIINAMTFGGGIGGLLGILIFNHRIQKFYDSTILYLNGIQFIYILMLMKENSDLNMFIKLKSKK